MEISGGLASERRDHNPQTAALLELTRIKGAVDVGMAMERAEASLSRWLDFINLGSLLRVISEISLDYNPLDYIGRQ